MSLDVGRPGHATVLVQIPEAAWVLGAGPAAIASGADARANCMCV